MLENVHVLHGQFTEPPSSKLTEEGIQRRPAQMSSEGLMYIGNWLWDKKYDRGTQIWPDGSVFEGDWLQDELWKGRLVMSSGIIYTGEW